MTFKFLLEKFQDLMEAASIQRASKAADALASNMGWSTPPVWMSYIGVGVDSLRNGYVDVGVTPGYPIPNLPRHMNGVPVVVKHRERTSSRPQ